MARIVVDNFFHMAPGHRLARNITVGGYVTNYGRYSPYDLYHPNGASMLLSDLLRDHEVIYSTQPFSDVTLCGADILVVPSPDYPLYEGASPYRLDTHDVEAMFSFLERGGSVLMLLNSFYPHSDFWEENFDLERINPIFDRLGLTWDANYMSDEFNILPSKSGGFTVGYGQGGRVKNAALPACAQPLLTYEGDVFGFIAKCGGGKLAVIGDAGLVSNGLYGFPGFDNKAFINDLISKLVPDFCKAPRTRFSKTTYGSLSCATNDNGISERLFKTLRPNALFKVDHHYRHLLWDKNHGELPAGDVKSELPFDIAALSGKSSVTMNMPLLPVLEADKTKTVEIPLVVTQTKTRGGDGFFLSSNLLTDELEWEDISAPVSFKDIGRLVRASSVFQAELSVGAEGGLLFATFRQGQIYYARNTKNEHYGYDILLCSAGTVYAPVVDK